jgi:RNA polymerase-interacting CarD/CdnL/TRCF family regulator
MDIRKDEHVLHAQHGVGKITSIRNRSFSGHAPATYVQLYFKRDELTMTVLQDDLPAVVRGLISSEQAEELLGQINAWNGKPETQWKARANAHQAAIDSGDPFEYSKVVKGLAQLESGGALRSCDREHLSKSLGLLTEELSCALNKSPQQVRRMLTQAIGASL